MVADSYCRVGIGTTTPGKPLEVFNKASNENFNNIARFACSNNVDHSDYTRLDIFQLNNSDGCIGIEVANEDNVKKNITLQPFSGKVGINLDHATPAKLLHIKQETDGSQNVGDAIRIEQADSSTSWDIGIDTDTGNGDLYFVSNGASAGRIVHLLGNATSADGEIQVSFTGQHRCIMNVNTSNTSPSLILLLTLM